MSPSNYQDTTDHVSKGVTMINGSRPSPLRINKDSHSINKQSSSPHHVTGQNTSHPTKNHGGSGGGAAKRQPVIIYTHSPKVIHAQARDFMALVQKLTGMSPAEEDHEKTTTVKSESEEGSSLLSSDDTKNMNNVGYEETESCSVMADEIMKQQDCPGPLYKLSNSNSYFDVPMFTPNSNDFFCSSTRSNPISPSLMDIMKRFQEY